MASNSNQPKITFKCGNVPLKNAKEISEFATSFLTEAENLVTQTLPCKVLELDNLYKSDHFSSTDLRSFHSEISVPYNGLKNQVNCVPDSTEPILDGPLQPSGKKRKYEPEEEVELTKAIPCNKKLFKLIEVLKPEIRQLIETCSTVQMWIQLLIPRIEDGNNFGVSIQEEVLSEINRIQSEASGYLDQMSRYYITRGKLLSKVVKYPYLDDYRRTITEIDEKEYLSLRMNCSEIRNHYLLLLDLVSKNFEKIKRPRSSNAGSMY